MLSNHKSAWHQEEGALSRHKLAAGNGACRHATFTLSTDVRNAKATSLTFVNWFVFGLWPAVLDLPREDTGSGVIDSPCRDPHQDDISRASNMGYQPLCSSTFWEKFDRRDVFGITRDGQGIRSFPHLGWWHAGEPPLLENGKTRPSHCKEFFCNSWELVTACQGHGLRFG